MIRRNPRFDRFLSLIFSTLSFFGLRIFPVYLVLEGLVDNDNREFSPDIDDYSLEFLGPEDMKEIAMLPDRKIAEEKLLQRLHRGMKCLGIKRREKIIAFTWSRSDEIEIDLKRIPLNPNEAYLFDTYTLAAFRGKGVAPYLRYKMYEALHNLGMNRLFSYSSYFNPAALKFKKKLNAKIIGLYLIIILFKKWCVDFEIKKFP